MNANEVLAALESMGTAQNCKVYARHGVGENMYGVSYANLGQLRKRIKMDHALAQKLWGTGNHDARVLAAMIADPAQADARWLEARAKELDNYVATDAFVGLVSRTWLAHKKAEKWASSKNEWIGRAGWHLIAHLALQDNDLPDKFFEGYPAIMVKEIHQRKNRTREAMNSALIAIGARNAALEKKALAAAKKIGVVEIDHGKTGCKTPDAATYIVKARQRKLTKSEMR